MNYCHFFFFYQVFETLLEKASPDIFNKLIPVAGDVGQDNLGLSDKDRQTLIDNVNVVIHSAATLDFEVMMFLVTQLQLYKSSLC